MTIYEMTQDERNELLRLADAYADAVAYATTEDPSFRSRDVHRVDPWGDDCCSCDCDFCGDEWDAEEFRDARIARDKIGQHLLGLARRQEDTDGQ